MVSEMGLVDANGSLCIGSDKFSYGASLAFAVDSIIIVPFYTSFCCLGWFLGWLLVGIKFWVIPRSKIIEVKFWVTPSS